jgi:hypothetical protein
MHRTMLLALLTLPATAAAQEKMRSGDFQAMSPQAIADALLPAGHVPIARVEFSRMGEPRPPAPFTAPIHSLRLYSVSAPISGDFCVQQEIVAEITPMPEAFDPLLDSPPRLLSATDGRQLYRYRPSGAACDGTRPHFTIDGAPVEEGLDAFRALIGAVRQGEKRSHKPLPFTVSCNGITLTCGSPRTVMRNLPYGEIISLEFLPDNEVTGPRRFSLLDRMSGRSPIRFRLLEAGMSAVAIHAVLLRGRIEKLEVEESSIVH